MLAERELTASCRYVALARGRMSHNFTRTGGATVLSRKIKTRKG